MRTPEVNTSPHRASANGSRSAEAWTNEIFGSAEIDGDDSRRVCRERGGVAPVSAADLERQPGLRKRITSAKMTLDLLPVPLRVRQIEPPPLEVVERLRRREHGIDRGKGSQPRIAGFRRELAAPAIEEAVPSRAGPDEPRNPVVDGIHTGMRPQQARLHAIARTHERLALEGAASQRIPQDGNQVERKTSQVFIP
jgi:hypothetical protein